jgi:AcrR family transcriptional regulator
MLSHPASDDRRVRASGVGYGQPMGLTADDGPIQSPSDVGALVRRARSEAGVSLRELARRIGVSAATVSAVENGKTQVTYTRLQQIAEALGRSAPELLLNVSLPGPPERSDLFELRRIYSELGDRSRGGDWRDYAPIPIGPVLLAGLAVFVETGYHGATVRMIADAAGMSVSGLYHYCTSKQDILVRLFEEATADLGWRTAAAAAAGDSVSERLALLTECHAQYRAQRWAFGLLLAAERRSLEPEARARMQALQDDERNRVEACIEAGAEAGVFRVEDRVLASRAILATCTSLPDWYRPGGTTTPAMIGRRCARLALDIVGAADAADVMARLFL